MPQLGVLAYTDYIWRTIHRAANSQPDYFNVCGLRGVRHPRPYLLSELSCTIHQEQSYYY